MKRIKATKRMGLTFLLATLIFAVQLVAVLIAVVVIAFLMNTGVVAEFSRENTTPGSILLLMAVISVISGSIVAAVSGKFYLLPINRFIDQMNRLASGDFKARIYFGKPIARHSTFCEISDSFNAMAEELENTEVLRSDFINNFSHEFKTPIVSIAGFAKLLRKGNLTPEQQEEYLAVIEEESLRLAHMATSVLDLTKIENQNILTDVQDYNLSEQIRSAILLLEDRWTRKNIDFNLQIGEIAITANEEMLKQAWINLLDNAVKYSEEDCCVEVTLEEQGDKIVTKIGNTGKTIPKESLGKIFNKFYQADESHHAKGNGIGLAIVKKVVELHNGTVTAESGPEQTVFTVILPKRQ